MASIPDKKLCPNCNIQMTRYENSDFIGFECDRCEAIIRFRKIDFFMSTHNETISKKNNQECNPENS